MLEKNFRLVPKTYTNIDEKQTSVERSETSSAFGRWVGRILKFEFIFNNVFTLFSFIILKQLIEISSDAIYLLYINNVFT